jgi:hypothetical protein
MRYVKLTAKPETWFKEGTEVYDYDSDYFEKKRITLDFWNKSLGEHGGGGIYVRGIRVCEDNPNEDGMGCKPGEERIDGEWCQCDEFNVEITDE